MNPTTSDQDVVSRAKSRGTYLSDQDVVSRAKSRGTYLSDQDVVSRAKSRGTCFRTWVGVPSEVEGGTFALWRELLRISSPDAYGAPGPHPRRG